MSDNPSHVLFSQLFRDNRDKVFRFALKLTGDAARADEITQQCFVRLWEHIGSVQPGQDIFPLLFVLVKRLVIDDTRRLYRERKKKDLLQQMPAATDTHIPIGEKELYARMQRAIDNMPEQRRIVYLMSRHEGRSYKEIAARLHLSPATVRNHLSLAMQYLRQELAVYRAE